MGQASQGLQEVSENVTQSTSMANMIAKDIVEVNMLKKTLAIIIGITLTFSVTVSGFAEELTPQLCKEKVKAAAKLLEKEGNAALAKIKDPKGEFRFADGAGYIWIHNLDGLMVMHPIKPSLDGRALGDMRDVNGVYLFKP